MLRTSPRPMQPDGFFSARSPLRRFVFPALLVCLLVLSILGFRSSWGKAFGPSGSIDFHPYWYFGHFVRAGINPYLAYENKSKVPESLLYWDGSAAFSAPEDHTRLELTVADTSPLLLFITPFSYFHWLQASFGWLLFNLTLVAVIPWLALRLLPLSLRLPPILQWLAAISFYAMKATREAVSTGQTTLFVFFLMIVTLLLPQSYWLLAGVTLGLALGKYSMALPICIYLLFAKRFRILIVAGVVQAVALAAVAMLDSGVGDNSFWNNVVATVQVHWGMVVHHTGLPGVYLPYVLRELPALATAGVVVVTLLTIVAFAVSQRRGWNAVDLLPVNSALVLWILLVVYHRSYDTVMVLLFWVFILSAMNHWQIAPATKVLLACFYGLALFILFLPRESLFAQSANVDAINLWLNRAMTAVLVVMLLINLWFLPRTPQNEAATASL